MSFIINPYAFSTGEEAPPGPDTISDLELWLKADAIEGLSSGDQISTWPDMSGNGRDCTGVQTSNSKPKWFSSGGPNGRPYVQIATQAAGFVGHFTVPNFLTGFTAGHCFQVIRIDNDPVINNLCCLLGNWGNAGDISLFLFDTDGKIYDDFGTSVRKETPDPVTNFASAWRMYEQRTASGAWSNWINGASHHSTGTNTVSWGTTPFIGKQSGTGDVWRGKVAEIIFFSRILDAGEITAVYDYLEDKYTITLP